MLTYEQYQEKMNGLASPEDVSAFNEEMAFDIQAKMPPKERHTAYFPDHRPIFHRDRKAPPAEANEHSPWFDAATTELDAIIIDLYAKGLSMKDIMKHLKRARNTELVYSNISTAIDRVIPLMRDWQSRMLPACYSIVYLDGIHFRVKDAGRIVSKVACIALGIDLWGYKEVLGIWITNVETSKFWMQVLTELKQRGLEDILITCVDGLKGFPDVIRSMFPMTDIQSCVVHQIRHTVKVVSSKERQQFCNELKSVYMATTEDAALDALEEMKKNWSKYAIFLTAWNNRWGELSPFFGYPEQVKRLVYTTNPIESLNSQLRRVTNTHGTFSSDDALMKILWLAQSDISEKWKFPIRDWGEIMGQLMYLFPDRVQF